MYISVWIYLYVWIIYIYIYICLYIYIYLRTLVTTLSLRYINMFCHIFSSLFYVLVRSLQETYCSTLKACITIINHVLNLSFYYIAYVCVNSIFYFMKL